MKRFRRHGRVGARFSRSSLTIPLTALIVVGVIGISGLALLPGLAAALKVVHVEVEHAQLSPGIQPGDTEGASENGSIGFGSVAVTPPGTPGIVFEDDFNGAAGTLPDASKWDDYSACSYNGSAAYGLIKCGNNELLDGEGHLAIPATPTEGSGIRTGNKFNFVYGTASAWIKLPKEVGYWPAFWTLNNNANGQDILPLGENDIMEGYTTWHDIYHAIGHNWTGNEATTSGLGFECGKGTDLTEGFHKYSSKFEPGKITYYFDDVQCGTAFTPESNPGKPWGFGPDVVRGNWLIFTMAIGGADGQQKPAVAPATMLVDRVEVRAE